MLRNIILTTTTSICCLNMAVANPRLDVLYHALEDSNAIYESRAFLPMYNSHSTMFFSDIRTISDLEDMTELNLGLGVRHNLHSMNTVLGMYYFYDQRSEKGIYRQNTIGGEVLSRYFEVRANYYMPFEEEGGNISSTTISYQDNVPHINKVTKGVLKGYDAEVGLVMPTKYFEIGVYGSLYKFYNDNDDNNNIVGKKIRGEVTVANLLPYNILATVGAEYDYNDDPDERVSRMSIKLGVPLNCKHYQPSKDGRMTKSIVRDLHIRVLDNTNVSEKAQAKVTLNNGSEVVFDKIFYVENGEELFNVINGNTGSEKIGIVLSNNIATLKDVELKSNHYIIGKKTDFGFVAINDQNLTVTDSIGEDRTLLYNSTVKAEDSNGSMVEVITTPSDQVTSASLSKIAKYSHDGIEYTELDIVRDQASLWSVLLKKDSIIVLDDDIEIKDAIAVQNGALIIGKGKITAQTEDNVSADVVLSQQRKITDTVNDLWENFGTNIASKSNIIFDGVDLDLKSRIMLSQNANLKFKNSTLSASRSSYYGMIDYYAPNGEPEVGDTLSFENTIINKQYTDPNIVVLGVESDLTKFSVNFKDVSIKMGSPTSETIEYVLGAPNVNIEGKFKVEHYGKLRWDASIHFDGIKTSKVTLNKNAEVIIENKNTNDVTKYQVTDTAIFDNSLNNQSIETDLSTLSDKIVKVDSSQDAS